MASLPPVSKRTTRSLLGLPLQPSTGFPLLPSNKKRSDIGVAVGPRRHRPREGRTPNGRPRLPPSCDELPEAPPHPPRAGKAGWAADVPKATTGVATRSRTGATQPAPSRGAPFSSCQQGCPARPCSLLLLRLLQGLQPSRSRCVSTVPLPLPPRALSCVCRPSRSRCPCSRAPSCVCRSRCRCSNWSSGRRANFI